jgi:hypothetical protein
MMGKQVLGTGGRSPVTPAILILIIFAGKCECVAVVLSIHEASPAPVLRSASHPLSGASVRRFISYTCGTELWSEGLTDSTDESCGMLTLLVSEMP